MSTAAEVLRRVRQRTGDRCEYCRMHQSLQGAGFHVEHITPHSRGGTSDMSNLAWCCPSRNFLKSNHITAIDPKTRDSVPFFHPRQNEWSDHFRWSGHKVVGRTAVGRATVLALNMNHPRRLQIRKAEEMFGLFPPEPRN